jgi:hypothetical protein
VSQIALLRTLSQFLARLDWRRRRREAPTMDCKIKAPPPAGRMWLVGLEIFDIQPV